MTYGEYINCLALCDVSLMGGATPELKELIMEGLQESGLPENHFEESWTEEQCAEAISKYNELVEKAKNKGS